MPKKLSDKQKSIILIGVILLLFIACFISGAAVQKRRNNKSITEYQNTISQLGEEITGLKGSIGELEEGNKRLRESNRELEESLSKAEERIIESKSIIDSIGVGLSESSGDIQSIIEAIDRVIEAIGEFENL